jgi:hypothetical protein
MKKQLTACAVREAPPQEPLHTRAHSSFWKCIPYTCHVQLYTPMSSHAPRCAHTDIHGSYWEATLTCACHTQNVHVYTCVHAHIQLHTITQLYMHPRVYTQVPE